MQFPAIGRQREKERERIVGAGEMQFSCADRSWWWLVSGGGGDRGLARILGGKREYPWGQRRESIHAVMMI